MNKFIDVHCPSCGAPANFDIVQQRYVCGYCGGKVGIREVLQVRQGFRELRSAQLQESVAQFDLYSASCSGCGATVVFEENEAMANCAFCGRALVRKKYLRTKNMPEYVIPFRLTQEEAHSRLREWCEHNKRRSEAKHLLPLVSKLKGFYLPYELVRGPVHMQVARMGEGATLSCDGFLNDEFINRSKQLDNLLLDGMEPFDIDEMTEFDFAYVAGHRIKTSDISDKVLEQRVREEVGATYTPAVRKTLESKAVDVQADVSSAMRLPVLLPVYYLCEGDLMAAVNGQTGKVSVRAEKESHYYFLPWWFKAIVATIAFCAIAFGVFHAFGMELATSLIVTGVLALFFIIVTLCVFSDSTHNSFAVEAGREVFTSGEQTFHREQGKLVQDDVLLERRVATPVFRWTIDGKEQPVTLRFTTPWRILKMVLTCLFVLFLPVIIALIINGFDFARLNLGGSAVWFCIAVPVVPIYLLKFGIVEFYQKPWVYVEGPNGRKRRWKEKRKFAFDKDDVVPVLLGMFVPPGCLAVWFAILSFCVMVYLTAFGFD